jgi:hypothetical protein
MLTVQQKLNRELTRIADEAKQWGWDKDIVDKMNALKTAELLGSKQESPGKSIDRSRNAAVETGTMAYYDAQMKASKPLIDENKKQTRHLAGIERTLIRQDTNKKQTFTVIG